MNPPSLENALEDHADGKTPLAKEDARKILERLRRLEQELDTSRDENRRLKEELRRYKSTLHFLAPDDKTVEAWGVPSSRCSIGDLCARTLEASSRPSQ